MNHIPVLKLLCKVGYILCLALIIIKPLHAVQTFTIPSKTVNWKTPLGETYSPYDTKGYFYKVFLDISVPAGSEGSYFLGFETNSGNMSRFLKKDNVNKIQYYLTGVTNTNFYLLDWPYIVSSSQTKEIELTGENLPTEKISFYIWVDPGQVVEPGTYTESIRIKLYSGNYTSGSVPVIMASGTLTINLNVSDQIQLSVGSDSAHSDTFEIKFERLVEDEKLVYDIFVSANDDYKLSVVSKNKGRLAHEIESVPTTIGYEMFVDSQRVQFNELGTADFEFEKQFGVDVTTHKVKVVLGKASHAFKGDYSDRVTLKAFPRN